MCEKGVSLLLVLGALLRKVQGAEKKKKETRV